MDIVSWIIGGMFCIGFVLSVGYLVFSTFERAKGMDK